MTKETDPVSQEIIDKLKREKNTLESFALKARQSFQAAQDAVDKATKRRNEEFELYDKANRAFVDAAKAYRNAVAASISLKLPPDTTIVKDESTQEKAQGGKTYLEIKDDDGKILLKVSSPPKIGDTQEQIVL